MEVTRSNFKDVLPQVKEAIEQCDFLAIDTELTGLNGDQKVHALDTMEERYKKLSMSSKGFLIIQFGISCFRYNKDTNKYIHRDFNFYIFPRPYNRTAPDPVFVCQPSSLVYLSSHGFDFNRLVNEGISYMLPQDEQRLRHNLKARFEEGSHSKSVGKNNGLQKEVKAVQIPDEHKDFIKDIHKKIGVFLSSKSQTLNLPPCTSYQRKLIYMTVEEKALTGLELITTLNPKKQSFIAITKVTEEEKQKKLQLKQLADTWELDDAVGFRNVLDTISSSKKLVIGHNMLLDLLHTVNQFFHPLPMDLREFKDMVKCIFPHILDTKTLASSSVFKDSINVTALPELFQELKKDCYAANIEAANDLNCYDPDMDKMHEAGFDAFVTGFCFVKLAALLDKHPVSASSASLTPYINRPFIMRHFDIKFLNLNGPDREPDRDHVFYVTFPKEWKTVDLVELFTPYGGGYVYWVNDTSAFVVLREPAHTINAKKQLLKQFNTLYNVKTYSQYWEEQYSPQKPNPQGGSNHLQNRRSLESSTASRTISPILEEDEAENISTTKPELVSTSLDRSGTEKTKASCSDTPKVKKQKVHHGDGEANEVSSTEKLFDEPEW